MNSRKLSLKTSVLNMFRRLFQLPVFEALLTRLSRGKSESSIIVKLLPSHYLYKSPSWRKVERNGVTYNLDISDIVDWYIFYDLANKPHDYFYNQIDTEGCVVIDVGANIGGVTLESALKNKNGMVYSIEPDPYNYEKLEKNIGLNKLSNIKTFQCGFGESTGQLSLNTSDKTNRGKNHIATSEELTESKDVIHIPIVTLDGFVEENKIESIDLLKIDVEGFELSVLNGGKSCIEKYKPLVMIEVDNELLNRYDSSIKELFNYFKGFGYKLIDPISEQEVNPADLTEPIHMDLICRFE